MQPRIGGRAIYALQPGQQRFVVGAVVVKVEYYVEPGALGGVDRRSKPRDLDAVEWAAE